MVKVGGIQGKDGERESQNPGRRVPSVPANSYLSKQRNVQPQRADRRHGGCQQNKNHRSVRAVPVLHVPEDESDNPGRTEQRDKRFNRHEHQIHAN